MPASSARLPPPVGEAPPGWVRHAITEYKPAGCPPVGAIWYQGPGGIATSHCFDEDEAIRRAWELKAKYERPATMQQDIPAELLNTITTGDARVLSERIPDASVDLCFCDPEYDKIEDYAWLAQVAARVLKPDGALLTFIGIGYMEAVMTAMRGSLPYRGMLTWNLKGPGNKRYGRAIDNGAWLLWYGAWPKNYMPLVWDSVPANQRTFRWQKNPVLTARHAADFTNASAIVFDPFTGGGTVPAVCKMLGRQYIAFEIDPDTAERARARVELTQPMHPILLEEQTALF